MDERKILEGLFLFQNLKRLPDLTRLPAPVTFAGGESIYAPDVYPRALGVVLQGRAEAVAARRDSAVLNAFGPGAVFGAASLFGGKAYVARVRAAADCRVQFLPEDTLRAWFAAEPQMALNYMAFLTDRVRFLNGRIAVYTSQGASGKLYSWLCANGDGDGALPKLSMTKLAAALNMGRTSLYRAFDELEKQNLLVRKDGKVRVIR